MFWISHKVGQGPLKREKPASFVGCVDEYKNKDFTCINNGPVVLARSTLGNYNRNDRSAHDRFTFSTLRGTVAAIR
jgi:hypothetical protein